MAMIFVVAGAIMTVVFATVGSWIGALCGLGLVICGIWGWIEESGESTFESHLYRIEDQVRRARQEVDRLEAEAFKALNDEAASQGFRKTS
jgi:hypothetical protein